MSKGFDRLYFHRIKAFEGPVIETFLPYFVPQMLDRVWFRAVRRQPIQRYIVRNFKALSFMPTSLIHDHDHLLVRMLTRCFLEEK